MLLALMSTSAVQVSGVIGDLLLNGLAVAGALVSQQNIIGKAGVVRGAPSAGHHQHAAGAVAAAGHGAHRFHAVNVGNGVHHGVCGGKGILFSVSAGTVTVIESWLEPISGMSTTPMVAMRQTDTASSTIASVSGMALRFKQKRKSFSYPFRKRSNQGCLISFACAVRWNRRRAPR